MRLLTMFVSEALRHSETDLDTAIKCIVNALCCRDINAFNRNEVLLILGDMQKKQRNQWRGIK